MKKTLLVAILIISLSILLASCEFGGNKTNANEENHTPSDWIVDSPATCISAGVKHKECIDCGEVLSTGVIGALEHNEIPLNSVAPSCTESGLTEGKKCVVCDVITVSQQIVAAVGHSASDATIENKIAPTCTLDGSCDSVVYCSVCNFEISREAKVISSLGHNFVDRACNNCGGQYSSEGLSFELNGDGLGYTLISVGECVDKNVIIDYYNELPVTEITANAFSGNTSIEKLTIGECVKYIGMNAFSGCTGLYEVKIGNGVTHIASFAFSGCSNLVNITIGESVKTIGNEAFSQCTSINKINFNAISADDLTDSSKVFYSYGGSGGIKFVVGNKVNRVPAYIFYAGNSSYCPKVVCLEFAVGSVCSSIGSSAFANNGYLVTAEIPDSITDIGLAAFLGCKKLESIKISNNVTKIYDKTFLDCSSLKQVTIPAGIKSIGSQAFYYCGSLTSVYISDIAGWCELSFADDYSNPLFYANNLYLNGVLVTELVIPDGAVSIPDKLFYKCVNISSVTIPESVVSIGNYAFSGCTGLAIVNMSDSVKMIGDGAFSGCTNLKNINLSNGLSVISNYLFAECGSLKSIEIPDRVISIGYSAFSSSGITTIIIPDSVKEIEYQAFCKCYSLTEVTIGSGVTNIEYQAFYLSGVTSVIFKNTEGWWGSLNYNPSITVDSASLSDPSTTANLLKSTYCDYDWHLG